MGSLSGMKSENSDGNGVVWSFLNTVVRTLGTEGMSSDDSDMEDMVAVYRTRLMPWRRDISKELTIIDEQHFKDHQIFSKGAKPAKRTSSMLPSSRGAMKGLPMSFYDADWMGTNNTNKAFPTDEQFLWMHIYWNTDRLA